MRWYPAGRSAYMFVVVPGVLPDYEIIPVWWISLSYSFRISLAGVSHTFDCSRGLSI